MLLSIIVYTLTAAVLFLLGWHVNLREERRLVSGKSQLSFWSWEILASVAVFTLIAGMRFKTGFDYAMYYEQYNGLISSGEYERDTFEFGYVWISKAFAALNVHYTVFFSFWALLQVFFLYYALRNRKWLLAWVGALLMLNSLFLHWMNTMRQGVVEAIFLTALALIERRKLIPYVIVALLSMLIHRSAFLLIPLYWLPCLHIERAKTKTLLIVLAVCVALGIYPIWLKAFAWLNDLLPILGFEKYPRFFSLISDGNFRLMAWGPVFVLGLVSQVILLLHFEKMKAFYKDDRMFTLTFVIAFLGFCLYHLLRNTSFFVLRPVEYLTVTHIIVFAYFLCYLYKTRRRFMLAVMCVLLFTPIYYTVYKAVTVPTAQNVVMLYHFYFAPSI